MILEDRQYPAKIILFGEQTVLHGSDALAIPFSHYSGIWAFGNRPNEEMLFVNKLLSKTNFPWFNYIHLKQDLSKNLFFNSTIPYSSGLGSSGALSAALYDRYAKEKESNTIELRERLAALESMFHGKSSGVDPYISYTKEGLKITQKGIIPISDYKTLFDQVYIIDSKVPRSAQTYIQLFTKKIQNAHFKNICQKDCIQPVNTIIENATSALPTRQEQLNALSKVSRFQYHHLPEFITANMKNIWKHGLDSGQYFMKLCGAGGGGFYLIFSIEPLAQENFYGYDIIKIFESKF